MAKGTRASKSTAQRIGERIRDARKTFGFTQAELAERSSMDNITISRLETGLRAPSLEQLERLGAAFKLPISHFVSDGEALPELRARELVVMLEKLTKEQQKFAVDLVRLYVERHEKKSKSDV